MGGDGGNECKEGNSQWGSEEVAMGWVMMRGHGISTYFSKKKKAVSALS